MKGQVIITAKHETKDLYQSFMSDTDSYFADALYLEQLGYENVICFSIADSPLVIDLKKRIEMENEREYTKFINQFK